MSLFCKKLIWWFKHKNMSLFRKKLIWYFKHIKTCHFFVRNVFSPLYLQKDFSEDSQDKIFVYRWYSREIFLKIHRIPCPLLGLIKWIILKYNHYLNPWFVPGPKLLLDKTWPWIIHYSRHVIVNLVRMTNDVDTERPSSARMIIFTIRNCFDMATGINSDIQNRSLVTLLIIKWRRAALELLGNKLYRKKIKKIIVREEILTRAWMIN